MDTSLVSPVTDLSGQTVPEIGFDTSAGLGGAGNLLTVDLSLDGGQTWTTVWNAATSGLPSNVDGYLLGHVNVPIPQAAGKPDVKVRFHYNGVGSDWELDNVYAGTRTCEPVPGGLVAGVVTDANTGDPVNGAVITNTADPSQTVTSAATPDDPGLPDGFYELFTSPAGNHTLTAAYRTVYGPYPTATAMVNAAADTVTRQDWTLKAGHLTVSQNSISTTATLGDAATANVTFGNNGTVPLHVRLGEQDTGFAPTVAQAARQAAEERTRAAKAGPRAPAVPSPRHPAFPAPDPLRRLGSTTVPAGGMPAAAVGPAGSWMSVPGLPEVTAFGVAAYNAGKVYSVTGLTNAPYAYIATANGYVFDVATQQWSPMASAPQALYYSAGGFVGGKLYVAGGIATVDVDNRTNSQAVYAYDPVSDSWSRVTDLPHPVSEAGAATLGGKLYIIGGCTNENSYLSCTSSNSVYRYDPATNRWASVANYPSRVLGESCGGVNGVIVCASGVTSYTAPGMASTYIYHPGTNTWTKGANMPYKGYGMAASAANNKLIVAGGISGGRDLQELHVDGA